MLQPKRVPPAATLPELTDVQTARPGPLQIDYSSTRVLPTALARLQRQPGAVQGDRSPLAEALKMLRGQLLQRMRADGHSVLAVTSPRAVAGKSLTAANLALAVAAELDTAVLLVDGDLSGNGLQTLFGLQGEQGLAEHLLHGTPLHQLLVNPGVERLVVLPAGQAGQQRSAELLATRAAQHLVQEMKQRYSDRIVIFDLPPLLDTADALAFLPQADTTLLVLQAHSTAIADMESASELLAPFNLVGSVLSPPPPKPPKKRWFE